MRNYNSSFKVRLTIDRICLLALFILVLAISSLMAFDEALAELITFEEFSEGTLITDQYRNLGVVFSDELTPPPVIAPLVSIFHIEDQSLQGYYYGPGVIATFIDPIDRYSCRS